MPALPVARARRRTRARSLNTVTSAMRASTIAAPSAVRGDITTPGTFSPRVSAVAGGTAWPPITAAAAATSASGRRRALNSRASARA